MDPDTLKRAALVNRADLKTARLEEEQEAAGIEFAKAEAKPDVTLSAGYTRQDNQFDGLFGFNNSGALSPLRDRDEVLKFGVSIPLRTSRSGAGNVQAVTARTAGARLRREYLERNIPLEVEAAISDGARLPSPYRCSRAECSIPRPVIFPSSERHTSWANYGFSTYSTNSADWWTRR
jgi:outer membrane protein TolC